MRFYYKSTKPRLTVEETGGKKLGNCYSASFYTVTSNYPISDEQMKALFETGAIGYGQEFRVVDSKEFSEIVPCVAVDENGNESLDAINPYSRRPYPPTAIPYYVYRIRTLCDSGD